MTTKPQRDPLHMAIMRAGKKEKTEDIAATIVPEMREIINSGITAPRAVADELNQRGILTIRQRRWTYNLVVHFLKKFDDIVLPKRIKSKPLRKLTHSDVYITRKTFARMLGIDVRTLGTWHNAKYTPNRHQYGLHVFYKLDEVNQWLSEGHCDSVTE